MRRTPQLYIALKASMHVRSSCNDRLSARSRLRHRGSQDAAPRDRRTPRPHWSHGISWIAFWIVEIDRIIASAWIYRTAADNRIYRIAWSVHVSGIFWIYRIAGHIRVTWI